MCGSDDADEVATISAASVGETVRGTEVEVSSNWTRFAEFKLVADIMISKVRCRGERGL